MVTLSQQNLILNQQEYAKGLTHLSSLPPVIFVELTQNCNLHCLMCRASNGYKPALDMNSDLFNRIKDQLFAYATIVDLRGWGESTMLRDFEQKVIETVGKGPRIRLVTNALAIRPVLWDLLMSKGARVIVSVDAATADTMRDLGRGSFVKLLGSLKAGQDALVRHKANGGRIDFNTVITSRNLDELEGIVTIAADYSVNRVTLFPVVARRTNPLHLDHRKGELICHLDNAAKRANALGIELRLGASVHEEYVVEEGLPNRCSHPWEYCYIDFSGNVGYCDHLIGNKELVVGNLNQHSFDAIWNGIDMQDLRKKHLEAKRNEPGKLSDSHPHCAWCYRRRYVDFEDETDCSSKPRVISNLGIHPLVRAGVAPFDRSDFMKARNLMKTRE